MTAPTQQEIDDIRNKDKQDKAYDDAMTVTEPNPAPKPKPKVAPKKLAKGGSVRGDGIAQRGKTRGMLR